MKLTIEALQSVAKQNTVYDEKGNIITDDVFNKKVLGTLIDGRTLEITLKDLDAKVDFLMTKILTPEELEAYNNGSGQV